MSVWIIPYFCTTGMNCNILRHNYFHIALLMLLATGLLMSCKSTKYLDRNEYLLRGNTIEISGNKANVEKEDLKSFIEQEPNKQFMGIRFNMWFYYWGVHGKDKPFNRWLKNKLGEPPVIFRERAAENSVTQIKRYLNNLGYFNAKVSFETTKRKHRNKIHLVYDVALPDPFMVKKTGYDIDDKRIKFLVLRNKMESLVDSGDYYNAFILEDERQRITNLLKNNGYFAFNKEYIFFEVDTTLGHRELKLTTNIRNVRAPDPDQPGQFIRKDHEKYFIGKIFINVSYNPLLKNGVKNDTMLVKLPRFNKVLDSNTYYFIYSGELGVKPQALAQVIYIRPDGYFVLNDVQETYRGLTNIRLFNYANIQFHELEGTPSDTNFLKCDILLSRSKLHAVTFEAEGTNTGGDLGIAGSISYQNKNIFRGAEILNIKIRGGMEVQRLSSTEEGDQEFLFFNTIETGAEAMLYFPRFLVPVPQTTFPRYFKPKTSINLGINYQQRPLYRRYIANLSFGYDWNENKTKRHIFMPFVLNSVKVHRSDRLDSILNNLTDERLKNQYTDHLIPSMKYSFIYNNQQINKLQNFLYFRGNIETSGNLLNAIDQIARAPKNDDGNYTLFGIRYAQYLRTDFDVRYYFVLNEEERIAVRGLFGIGIPYGNSTELPFEKGFYGGGTNGMRGWRFRSLGPGSYANGSNELDRMGDLKLETNVEYRFPIYKFFKSAIFIDAGNIWLLNSEASFPGGKFSMNDFYKEIAMDTGLGFRFDFGFFVFRVDAALPVHDPSQPKGERWVLDEVRINWNFGIGYPF